MFKRSLLKAMANRIRDKFPVRIILEFQDGQSFSSEKLNCSRQTVTIRFKTKAAESALITRGFTGFGEHYVDGTLEVEGNLVDLLYWGLEAGCDEAFSSFQETLRKLFSFLHRLRTVGTLSRSKRNVVYHYDKGNDFYKLWLDDTMTYSCAYFHEPTYTLKDAQLAKYELICRKLRLKPGDRLLDIGCGWGGMLLYAAQHYKVKGVGITPSDAQYDFALQRINEYGLQNLITILKRDYRELAGFGQFNKLVSIGMFEHVGKRFMPVFMKQARRLLCKGGLGLLHTIGEDFGQTGDSWLERYVFPGSYIPRLSEIAKTMEYAGFPILDVDNLRIHYAQTAEHWLRNFEAHIDDVREIYLDERFIRLWRLYLAASTARFKHGDALYQVLFSNGHSDYAPVNRAHIYGIDFRNHVQGIGLQKLS